MATPIEKLIEACAYYCGANGRKIPQAGASAMDTSKWISDTVLHAEEHKRAKGSKAVRDADKELASSPQ